MKIHKYKRTIVSKEYAHKVTQYGVKLHRPWMMSSP